MTASVSSTEKKGLPNDIYRKSFYQVTLDLTGESRNQTLRTSVQYPGISKLPETVSPVLRSTMG